MNLRDLEVEMMRCFAAGLCVKVTGGSGFGKTQKTLQMFAKIKARDAKLGIKWGLSHRFGARLNPTDMSGYIFKGEKAFGENEDGSPRIVTVSDESVPVWYLSTPHGDDPGGKPAYMYDRMFFLIDEYGQTDPEAKKIVAEIALNGGTLDR